jgi:hypothetical protein
MSDTLTMTQWDWIKRLLVEPDDAYPFGALAGFGFPRESEVSWLKRFQAEAQAHGLSAELRDDGIVWIKKPAP